MLHIPIVESADDPTQNRWNKNESIGVLEHLHITGHDVLVGIFHSMLKIYVHPLLNERPYKVEGIDSRDAYKHFLSF